MTTNKPEPQVVNAIKERAMVYLALYRELSKRYGKSEAVDVMRSAIYEHGKAFGKTLTCHAPCDFAGLLKGFAMAPDDGATFSPAIKRVDENGLEVQMMTCPLKTAWLDAGCSDDEVRTLLYCASAVDEGTLDAAGFSYEITLAEPGDTGCCSLQITSVQRCT